MLEKARYIAVEGPIGAGKTSLARRLAEHLDADLLLEQPERNPFLGRFYQNMERYALQTQLSFLLQRMEMVAELAQRDPNGRRLVADFLLEKDPLFAEINLPEDERAVYRSLFERLGPQAPAPDLVIYLQADPQTLVERVRKRNVEAERRIGEDYLARVAAQYTRFFHDYAAAPLFIVGSEGLNPVDEQADFELLLERLRAMRGYREFFAYAS